MLKTSLFHPISSTMSSTSKPPPPATPTLLDPPIFLLTISLLLTSHALVLSLNSPPFLKLLAATVDLYLLISFSRSRRLDGPFIQTWMQGMTLFGTVVICFNLVVLRDRRGYVRVDGRGREVGGYAFDGGRGWGARVRDALEVVLGCRGVGWKWQVGNLPRPPYLETISTSRFVVGNAWGIVWRMVLIEAHRVYFLERSIAMGDQNLHHGPWWGRLLVGAACIFQARITIELPHLAASMLGVMLGWGRPSDWPPMFGSVTDAWSIRRYWSRYWHQILRGMAEPPVGFVLHGLLRVPRGSYLSNYGKVFGNFYVAYLMHAIPRVVAGGDVTPEWNFYMGQAVVIWLEVVVSQAAFALGFPDRPRVNRVIGYIWTFLFQSWAWLHYNNAIHSITDLRVPVFGVRFVEPLLKLAGWN